MNFYEIFKYLNEIIKKIISEIEILNKYDALDFSNKGYKFILSENIRTLNDLMRSIDRIYNNPYDIREYFNLVARYIDYFIVTMQEYVEYTDNYNTVDDISKEIKNTFSIASKLLHCIYTETSNNQFLNNNTYNNEYIQEYNLNYLRLKELYDKYKYKLWIIAFYIRCGYILNFFEEIKTKYKISDDKIIPNIDNIITISDNLISIIKKDNIEFQLDNLKDQVKILTDLVINFLDNQYQYVNVPNHWKEHDKKWIHHQIRDLNEYIKIYQDYLM